MSEVIKFTSVEFKCSNCGKAYNIVVDGDPEGDHYRVGGEVECMFCDTKHRITEGTPEIRECLIHGDVEVPKGGKVDEDTGCPYCPKCFPQYYKEGGRE